MATKPIEVEVKGYDTDYISGISAALKIAKAYGEFIKMRFLPSGIQIFVHPESYETDLCKIYNLERELMEYKKNYD